MRSLRIILIVAAALLCIVFTVQLGLSVYEDATWPKPSPGFAVDAAPQYTVGLYHALSIFLLLSLIHARVYLTAFLLSAGYILVHSYATYWRLRTGFFGGDMCPDGGFCKAALRRGSLFDWTATVLLLVIFCLIVAALFYRGRTREVIRRDQTPRA